MKLQLLHGPGLINSRSKLQIIKKQFDISNVVVFGEEINPGEILGSLVTPSLFPDPRLVVLENPSEDLSFDFCGIPDSSTTVLIWLDHEINVKSTLWEAVRKQKGEVLFFGESREITVFPFLDYLAAKDKKAFLELEKLKSAGFDIFYALNMVFYLLRNLVSTPKSAHDFVRKKLIKQRLNFSMQTLQELYRAVLEIEYKLKMGLLDQPQAEYLLITLFVD